MISHRVLSIHGRVPASVGRGAAASVPYARLCSSILTRSRSRTSCIWTEAQVLAQLRTGHSKLRGFLARIGAEETDQCECGQGKENTRHFLFHCQRYQHLQGDMIKGEQYGNLSYMLDGGDKVRSQHKTVTGDT